MTITSEPDDRNAEWMSSTSSFGQKMLLKMGWKDGRGLGRSQQGAASHLRAVRREESLGIGAATDSYGAGGWDETSRNFGGLLASLKAQHDKETGGDKKNRKRHRSKRDHSKDPKLPQAKKQRKLEKKTSGLTLASNKVTAGHARKMRDAKDLTTKSEADMAAIFGIRAPTPPPPAVSETVQKNVRTFDRSERTTVVGEKVKKEERTTSRSVEVLEGNGYISVRKAASSSASRSTSSIKTDDSFLLEKEKKSKKKDKKKKRRKDSSKGNGESDGDNTSGSTKKGKKRKNRDKGNEEAVKEAPLSLESDESEGSSSSSKRRKKNKKKKRS